MKFTPDGHLPHIEKIAQEDASGLLKAHESYGPSWKQRGGIGAYMVMIRKFDRMEIQAEKHGFDILKAVKDDPRAEGLLDDIRDARRYLLLIEAWLRELGIVDAGNHRDNVTVNFGGPATMAHDVTDPTCACPVCSGLVGPPEAPPIVPQAESRCHRRHVGGPVPAAKVYLSDETAKDRENSFFSELVRQQQQDHANERLSQVKTDEPIGGCDES